jgi:hypothetical protein
MPATRFEIRVLEAALERYECCFYKNGKLSWADDVSHEKLFSTLTSFPSTPIILHASAIELAKLISGNTPVFFVHNIL